MLAAFGEYLVAFGSEEDLSPTLGAPKNYGSAGVHPNR